MNRFDLVIFDFDGTLADSAAWFRANINHIAQRYRFRQVTPAELESLRGQTNAAIIRHLGVPMWKLPLIANYARKLVARDAHTIAPFKGIDTLLTSLTQRGISIAIVTSNTEDNVRRILGSENAARVAYYACGASMFGKAAKFRAVLKATHADPARTIAIGDEARDIDAARKAGIPAGAVTWGYATAELLRAQQPDHLFSSMDEIVRVAAGGLA
jgi:phosphoglycolate phosphatase